MDIFDLFCAARNDERAAAMSAYMKNQFEFLGIPKPERTALAKDFLRGKKAEKTIDWDFVDQCFARPEREFQYLALEYLFLVKARMGLDALPRLERLVAVRSWWDTVDSLSSLLGDILLHFPEARQTEAPVWINCYNIWFRRVSIIFQLKYKAQTDTNLLSRAILRNCTTREFFLNKAIGWALREYSKTDPDWVRDFVAHHKLNALSVREASKYI